MSMGKSKREWLVYVSGPITGATAWEVEQNIRLAEVRTVELIRAGFTPLCMHAQCRFMDGLLEYSEWLVMDLEILRRCDAVVLSTMDYHKSKGTLMEIAEAERLGIPVFFNVVALEQHAKRAGLAA